MTMPENISIFLEDLGLEEYTDVFVKNDIDIDTLAQLRDKDFQSLGLSLGARFKIGAAIRSRDIGKGKLFDLGLVFVHGVGAKRQGDILSQCADALVNWLNATRLPTLQSRESRNTIQATWKANVDEADLRPETGDAFAEIEVQSTETNYVIRDDKPRIDNQQSKKQRWLLTEAWWTREFEPPSYAELIRWGVNVFPWTLAIHLFKQLANLHTRDRTRTGIQVLDEILYTVIALILAPLVLILMALISLLGLVPLEFVRGMARWFQKTLATTLGDSYTLLVSPSKKAAILTSVEARIRAIAPLCRHTCVIAHSQGAAIAHAVVKSGDVSQSVETLITYGSGVEKLSKLETYLSGEWAGIWSSVVLRLAGASALLFFLTKYIPNFNWLITGTILIIVAAMISFIRWVWIGSEQDSEDPLLGPGTLMARVFASMVIIFISLAGIVVSTPLLVDQASWSLVFTIPLVLVVTAIVAMVILGNREFRDWAAFGGTPKEDGLERLGRNTKLANVQWVDLHASSDPVCNGPIFPGINSGYGPGWPRSFQIYNRGSFFLDHTSYWENRDEFVTRLMSVVLRTSECCSIEVAKGLERRAMSASSQRRGRIKVRWYTWLVFAIYWATFAILFHIFRSENNYSWLTSTIELVEYMPLIGRFLVDDNWFVGHLVILGTVCLQYVLMTIIWGLWDRSHARRFLDGEDPRWRSIWAIFYLVTFIVVSTLGVWLLSPLSLRQDIASFI